MKKGKTSKFVYKYHAKILSLAPNQLHSTVQTNLLLPPAPFLDHLFFTPPNPTKTTMGVVTYDMEVTSSIPPAKMFKAFVLDADTLIPKVLPQAIKSVEILEGDGGAGTVKLTTFGEGSQFKSVKHRVDELDKENFVYKYSIVEGDALMGVLESISYVVKIEASGDGSVCKNTSTYYTKGDAQINEEKLKAGKEKASAMFKAIEAYVQANPDY